MALERRTVADHEVCREERDLFVYRFPRGTATAAHVEEIVKIEQRAWKEGVDHVYNMAILGDGLAISPGALSVAAAVFRASPPRTTAFVMRRFVLRTAMEFLTRMLRGLRVPMEAAFFDEETKAREWLAKKREERARAAAARKNGLSNGDRRSQNPSSRPSFIPRPPDSRQDHGSR